MYYLFQLRSACNLSVSLRVLFSPGHKNVVGDFSGVGQKLFVYIFASLPELRWGYLACLGLVAVSHRKMVLLCHAIDHVKIEFLTH